MKNQPAKNSPARMGDMQIALCPSGHTLPPEEFTQPEAGFQPLEENHSEQKGSAK